MAGVGAGGKGPLRMRYCVAEVLSGNLIVFGRKSDGLIDCYYLAGIYKWHIVKGVNTAKVIP